MIAVSKQPSSNSEDDTSFLWFRRLSEYNN